MDCFRRVAADLVRLITPMPERENRYMLVMVDYLEAMALPVFEVEGIAEELMSSEKFIYS